MVETSGSFLLRRSVKRVVFDVGERLDANVVVEGGALAAVMRCAVCRGRGLTTVWLQKPRLGLVASRLARTAGGEHAPARSLFALASLFTTLLVLSILSKRLRVAASLSRALPAGSGVSVAIIGLAMLGLIVVSFRSRTFRTGMFDLCRYFSTGVRLSQSGASLGVGGCPCRLTRMGPSSSGERAARTCLSLWRVACKSVFRPGGGGGGAPGPASSLSG